MSVELNVVFRRDPVGVASRIPIVSFDKENSNVLKVKGDAAENLRSVRGSQRIAAIDLKQLSNANGVSVAEKELDAKLLDGWLPCYYLPWIANGVARTTLRPRSATTRDGVAKNIVRLTANPLYRVDQNNPLSAVLDPNDPDIFFTSAVNGCTVTVRGTREEPTVYHANAKDLKVEGEKSPLNAALHGGGDAFAQQVIDGKRDWMVGKINRLEQVDQKQQRGAGLQTPAQRRLLGQDQYQMLVAGGEVSARDRQNAEAAKRNIVATEGGKKKDLRLASSQGTVFGLRTNGHWTFYFQKLVKYEWWHDTAGIFKKAHWERDQSRAPGYTLVAFGEFWPNGAGILVP